MAHDMYGINGLLQKFPLVGKAFGKMEASLEAAFFPLGGEAAAIKGPKLLIDTVDQNFDGTDAEKQALIIAAMYLLSPDAQQTDCGSTAALAAQYGEDVAAIVFDTVSKSKTAHRGQIAPVEVARAGIVTSIVALGLLTATLMEAAPKLPAAQAQKMKNGMMIGAAILLPNLTAPKLEVLYQATTQAFFSEIDRLTVMPGKKPDGPKI